MRNVVPIGKICFAIVFAALVVGAFSVSVEAQQQVNRNAGVSVEILCVGEGCEALPPQVVPQPGPGPRETRAAVVVEGFGPPSALLYILKDGGVARTAATPLSGIFSVTLTGLSPGQTTIGVFAVDSESLTTPTISVGVVLYEGTVTRIYDILLPPTIRAEPASVRQGERVTISGQTFPRASVRAQRAPDRQTQEVVSDSRGRWEATYATEGLIGTYTATARSFLGSGLLSEESQQASFSVIPIPGREPTPPREFPERPGEPGEPGRVPPPRPEGVPPPTCSDINGDRRVDVIDFSILMYHWGVPKDPSADCNGDGQVNLIDFSVMLYWWTG